MPRVCPHCGARHPQSATHCEATGLPIGGDPTLVGQLIGGRYALVRLLGDGGMGAVYKAADQVLRRFVAIKLLHASVSRNPNTVERFQREARAAAAIGHPNIIDILDFGHEKERPFIVMEYLRGQSVSQYLAHGPLPIRTAVAIATHTLNGLAAVHECGILHRDLKPANLMLIPRFGDRNFVKILDFGFAALMGNPSESRPERNITPERTLVGTPAYAAPERLRGEGSKDPRIDVYSLGVVLYEMICGERPFDAPTFAELAKKVKYEEPQPLRERRRDLSPGLEQVIMTSLSKNPDARYPTAKAFAEALVPFGGRGIDEDEQEQTDSFTVEMERIRSREKRAKLELPKQKVPSATSGLVESVDSADVEKITGEGEKPVVVSGPPVRVHASLLRGVFTELEKKSGRERLARLIYAARAKELVPYWNDHVAMRPSRGYLKSNAVEELVASADKLMGSDDLALAVDCGRAAADGGFGVVALVQGRVTLMEDGTQQPMQIQDTISAFTLAPQLVQLFWPDQPVRVDRVGPGYARIEVQDQTSPLSICLTVMLLGLLERVLMRLGGKDVEVNLASARALHDARTLIDVSWLS